LLPDFGVGFDYQRLGQKFQQMFMVVLARFALGRRPFLITHKIGFGAAFAVTAALLYVPFSERTLIRMAYGNAGNLKQHGYVVKLRRANRARCTLTHPSKIQPSKTHSSNRLLLAALVLVLAASSPVWAADWSKTYAITGHPELRVETTGR